jgi:[ribosomal protein S18]-alanine N-acetyltransferase
MRKKFKMLIYLPISLFHRFNRNISDYFGSLPVKKYSHSSNIIRRFKDSDLEKILEIFEDSFGNKNYNQIIKYSKLFKNTFYIYEINGAIVGYVGYYIHRKFDRYRFIQIATAFSGAVDRKMQNQGIFTTLYAESLLELENNNVQSIYAFVNVNNNPILSILKKLGFMVIMEVKNICGADDCYKVELRLNGK